MRRKAKRAILGWLALNALAILAMLKGGGRSGVNDHPFIRNGMREGY